MASYIPESRYAEFIECWNDETATGGYIRERFGVSWAVMERTRLELGLPQRSSRSHLHWTPLPMEIEQRAAEARAKWGGKRERSRQTSQSTQRFELPVYSYDRKTMSFS